MRKDKIISLLSLFFIIWVIFVLYSYFREHSVYLLFFEFQRTILLEFFFIFYFSFVAYIFGATLFRWFGLGDDDFEEKFLIKLIARTTLGFGAISLLTFFIGIFGLYYFSVLLIINIVLILISAKEIRKILEWSQSSKIKFDAISNIAPASLFWSSLIGLSVLMRFCTSLTPPFGDDAQWYHIGIPLDYLSAHKFFLIKDNPASSFPANFEMLSLQCLAFTSDIAVNFLNFLIGLLLLLTVYSFSKRFLGEKAALPVSAIFYSDPTIQFLNSEIKNDQFLALSILLSIYFFLIFWEGRKYRYLNMSGVFLGIALGTKYTAINILPFYIMATFFVIIKDFKKVGQTSPSVNTLNRKQLLFRFLLFCFIFSSPWYIKNFTVYQNPVAPFYNRFCFWKGGKVLKSKPVTSESKSIETQKKVGRIIRVDTTKFYGMGRSFKDYILLPWNITIYGKRGTSRFDSTISPIYLAFIPFLFFVRRNKKIFFLLFLFMGQFFAWAFQESQNSRYLVLGLPILIIIVGYVILNINSKFVKTLLYTGVMGIVFLFTFTEFLFFVHTDAQPYRFVFNLETREDYLKRVAGPLFEGCSFLRNEWNKDHSINALFIGTRSNYFFRENSHPDYGLTHLAELIRRSKSPEGIRDDLKRRKFNRVLVEYKMLIYFYSRSPERRKELAEFQKFRDLYLKPLFIKEGLSQIVYVYSISDKPLK